MKARRRMAKNDSDLDLEEEETVSESVGENSKHQAPVQHEWHSLRGHSGS